jgi:phthalate 4,5-cis-dihydrodiol dehydrogenase
MNEPLRLGVIGLGRAFTLMLPTFLAHPRVSLVAASDPRSDAVARFASEFNAAGYASAEALCADPGVQAVYVASPHQFHADHVNAAARFGKHILVEKPMALTIDDCVTMIESVKAAGVYLLVGHSHSYDLPYLRARDMIASGEFGRVRMVNALNFTDFLYRPRRPEEFDSKAGGGVVFSQAAHQIDIVRLLAGAKAKSLRAATGAWDPTRNTEGAYCSQILFEDGSFASLTYSGYAHFDTDEFNEWWGELGRRRTSEDYGRARQTLRGLKSTSEEIEMKNRRAYGPAGSDVFNVRSEISHNHFGFVLVSCEKADLRPMPNRIIVYGNDKQEIFELPQPHVPRAEVVDELYDAAILGKAPLHSGEWGLATLEACLAILESSSSGREVPLRHQI